MPAPPRSRPPCPPRTHSLPSAPASSHCSSASSSSSRSSRARPRLARASTSLRASSSQETDESDDDRADFSRRYLSRRGSFGSDEDEERERRAASRGFVNWSRGYMPFTSRSSSRSSSSSSSSRTPKLDTSSSRPRRTRRDPRLPSTSSHPASTDSPQHLLLHDSSLTSITDGAKSPATLGLIDPSFAVLSWSLSLPLPHPSSYPHFKNSHRILIQSRRMYRTSLSLNHLGTRPSNLSAPVSSKSLRPGYPSPAGSDLTIRPSSTFQRQHSNPILYPCSPPPFRTVPSATSSRASFRSFASEAGDDLDHLPSAPTSYTSYLQAGESSPSSEAERTPRASRASSSWSSASSPTATTRRQGGHTTAPSLSYTASTRASSIASVGSLSSPRAFFGGGSGRRRTVKEEVDASEGDEETMSPPPSYLTFGSLKNEGVKRVAPVRSSSMRGGSAGASRAGRGGRAAGGGRAVPRSPWR